MLFNIYRKEPVPDRALLRSKQLICPFSLLENEHDQAIAAYFKAYQLMPGCHLPLLYIGVEYGLTNNVKLAEKFFEEASKIAPEDPFVLHELGVTCSQNGE